MNSELVTSLIQAIVLGFAAAAILWLLRNFSFARRIRFSVLGAALIVGVLGVLRAFGLQADQTLLQVVVTIGIMLAANASLQLFDLIVWDYLFLRRRRVVVPRLLVDMFNLAVLVAVALGILSGVFGVNLSALLVTSTVVSAVIGLSLQDTLGNIVSGLALQIDRPFDVGDWVLINGEIGEVMQMSWRTLTLRNHDQHMLTLANSIAARQDIVNYSRPTSLQRMHATIGLRYEYPPGEVKRILEKAAAAAEGVAADPPPDVLVKEYGDSSVNYDVRYWITDFSQMPEIGDAVMTRLWYAVNRAGWSVPFPIRDVNLRTLPEDHEQQKLQQQRREIFAQLRPLDVFAPLDDAEIDQLARVADLKRYTAGETLVEQGDQGDSLFVIKSGHVRVDVRGDNGIVTTVAERGANEFFGEMSLLTGERRSASVVAQVECQVIVVGKAAFGEILRADVSKLEALSVTLDGRQRATAARVAEAEKTLLPDEEPAETKMLKRIRNFFAIK